MPRRFEAFHRPFALSGGLMRVLGAVVQIPLLLVSPQWRTQMTNRFAVWDQITVAAAA